MAEQERTPGQRERGRLAEVRGLPDEIAAKVISPDGLPIGESQVALLHEIVVELRKINDFLDLNFT